MKATFGMSIGVQGNTRKMKQECEVDHLTLEGECICASCKKIEAFDANVH